MSILERPSTRRLAAIQGERRRQQTGLEMIASERLTSSGVLALSRCFSADLTIYAEGYLRQTLLHGGPATFVDQVAKTARSSRVLKSLQGGAQRWQPASGAQANTGVFLGRAQSGDTHSFPWTWVAARRHLTHGHEANFSGKYCSHCPLRVSKTDERSITRKSQRLARETTEDGLRGASRYHAFKTSPNWRDLQRGRSSHSCGHGPTAGLVH